MNTHATTAKKRHLGCTCCGAEAGKWMQWHNRDTGFGICRSCVDWIMTRQVFCGRPDPVASPLEFCRAYGLPGQNYEPRMHRLFGRAFAVVAEFPNSEQGAKDANDFMEAFKGVGLLEVVGDRIILADMADEGVAVPTPITTTTADTCHNTPTEKV